MLLSLVIVIDSQACWMMRDGVVLIFRCFVQLFYWCLMLGFSNILWNISRTVLHFSGFAENCFRLPDVRVTVGTVAAN